MRWFFGRAALWMWVTALSAAIAFSAGQETSLPEGQGRNLLEVYCTTCHNLTRVTNTHADKDTWAGIIQAMKDKRDGPMLTEEDQTILVEYLVKYQGTTPAQPADSTAPAAGSEASAEGKQLVESNCTSCHGIDLVESQRLDRSGWEMKVQAMIALGAPLSEAQIPVVVDYLAKTYPPDAK